jgi:transposase
MKFENFIKTLVGYERLDVLDFRIEEDKYHPEESVFIASVALWEEEQYRCPKCGRKCGKYDRSNYVKRWRSLDLSKNKFFIECRAPRCICPEHGVYVVHIPWAFPDSHYTRAFEMRVACAAAKMPTNLLSRQYRIKWATVGSCVRRVQQNVYPMNLKSRKLKKIAIDETSYQKGYKYITTVQDLETGEIIWSFDGYGDEVLKLFFESLTEKQCAEIEFVVADGARWITRQVEKFCPQAKRCVDPFHVVGWATEALDTARKRLSNDAKKNGSPC